MVSRSSATAILSQHGYLYEGFANRRQAIDKIGTVTQTNTYLYDALDRLISAKNGTATLDESYQYDPINKLSSRQIGTTVTVTTASVYATVVQLIEAAPRPWNTPRFERQQPVTPAVKLRFENSRSMPIPNGT